MKSQVLHTVWCHISCEAAGEFWHWSLSGVKGLTAALLALLAMQQLKWLQCTVEHDTLMSVTINTLMKLIVASCDRHKKSMSSCGAGWRAGSQQTLLRQRVSSMEVGWMMMYRNGIYGMMVSWAQSNHAISKSHRTRKIVWNSGVQNNRVSTKWQSNEREPAWLRNSEVWLS